MLAGQALLGSGSLGCTSRSEASAVVLSEAAVPLSVVAPAPTGLRSAAAAAGRVDPAFGCSLSWQPVSAAAQARLTIQATAQRACREDAAGIRTANGKTR